MVMDTMTRVETKTITGTDVREVADCIWQEVLALYEFYGRNFPYHKQKLRGDLGQIMLWGMADAFKVQFYEDAEGKRNEKLSYEFVLRADPGAVHTPPGNFPRFQLQASWQVRLVAIETTAKPEAEVQEFYLALGWRYCDPLIRNSQGTTEKYGDFRSGDYGVSREVWKDVDVHREEDPQGKEVEI
jgi:hypothetical protein